MLTLQEISDRIEIQELLVRYSHAVDTRNWEMYENVFTPVEVDILNEAIDWVCDTHTARSISELSHDMLWGQAELGEQIPIGAATIVPEEISGEDISWALRELAHASA